MKTTCKFKRWLAGCYVAAVSCFLVIGCDEADEAVRPGTLQGTVTSCDGGPAVGATLHVSGGPVTPGAVTTDAAGFYQFGNLAAGTYNLHVAYGSCAPSAVNGVVVRGGATTTQDFTLTPQAATDTTTYSGQAKVASGTVSGSPVTWSDTGPLPPQGGALETSLLEADVTGPVEIHLKVLHATAVGQGSTSRSEASLANFSLTAGETTIAAEFLMARATAVCSNGQASASGTSDIALLVVNGEVVNVNAQPNQAYYITNQSGDTLGHLIINEQILSGSGAAASITVNAIHVFIAGHADVIIGSAHADVNCGATTVPGEDFVTGGGWITGTPSGVRANFGVAGGIRGGQFWGHLNYIDHGNPMVRVRGTSITEYTIVNATTRRIAGTAEINGDAGHTFQVDVADNGEPGSSDTFTITLSNGYSAAGTLGGGNIQLHTGG